MPNYPLISSFGVETKVVNLNGMVESWVMLWSFGASMLEDQQCSF
jgi:hypothetical protein